MSNFNTNKINGSTLEADEWNQLQDLENLVSTSGINPDISLLNQIPQAVSNYVAIANFYTDNGIVNAYNLTPINNFKSPTQYITGMLVRFRTTNANTGASTVNVSSLGVKNIKKADGITDLVAGDIATGTDIELRYDGTNFLLNSVVLALASASTTAQGIQYLNKPITISNNITDANNDIDFSAGNFQFSDGTGSAIVSAMTKRLDANWTAGNNNGGLDTGTKANNTWYYCYAIYNPTTQASDFLFSASPTSPTLPSGFTKFTYRGAIFTNVSGNITPFYYDNIQDCYIWITASLDFNISSWASMPTTLTPLTLKCPPNKVALVSVSGLCDDVLVNVRQGHSNATEDELGSFTNTGAIASSNTIPRNLIVNSNSQIEFRGIGLGSAQIQSFYIKTIGFKI